MLAVSSDVGKAWRARWHERHLVTVVGPNRRLDLRLPGEATVEELIPHLLALVGDPEDFHEDNPGSWCLTTVVGAVLTPTLRLGELGVVDGDVLYLEMAPKSRKTASSQRDAEQHHAGARLWEHSFRQRLVTILASVFIVFAAIGVAVFLPAGSPGAVVAAIAGLGGLGTLTMRIRKGTENWTWLALASLAVLGSGVWQMAAASNTALASAITAGGSLLVASALLACAGRPVIPVLTGVLFFIVPAEIVMIVTMILGADIVTAAAFTLILWTIGMDFIPRLAVFASGADRPAPGKPRAGVPLAEGEEITDVAVQLARPVLTSLLVSSTIGLCTAWVMLVLAGGWPGALLSAASVSLIALQARHHKRAIEVATLTIESIFGFLVVLIGFVIEVSPKSARPADVMLVLVVAIGAGLTVGRAPVLPEATLSLRRFFRRAKLFLRISLLPLALWIAGIYGGIAATSAHLAHHL